VEIDAACLYPTIDVPVAVVAVLDGLEEALELVGVVRAVDLQVVAILVLLDEAAELLGDCGRKRGCLSFPGK